MEEIAIKIRDLRHELKRCESALRLNRLSTFPSLDNDVYWRMQIKNLKTQIEHLEAV